MIFSVRVSRSGPKKRRAVVTAGHPFHLGAIVDFLPDDVEVLLSSGDRVAVVAAIERELPEIVILDGDTADAVEIAAAARPIATVIVAVMNNPGDLARSMALAEMFGITHLLGKPYAPEHFAAALAPPRPLSPETVELLRARLAAGDLPGAFWGHQERSGAGILQIKRDLDKLR